MSEDGSRKKGEGLSKYIQIDIRLLAAFGTGGFKSAFPNLHNLLSTYRYDLVIEREPSLYDMVEVLVRIRNDPNISVDAKEPVTQSVNEFVKVRDEARELLLSRRLNELDRLLYRLEDLFAELERKLG
jgi:hypothetical protein